LVSEICKQTKKQTDIQTNTLLYFAPLQGWVEVITIDLNPLTRGII